MMKNVCNNNRNKLIMLISMKTIKTRLTRLGSESFPLTIYTDINRIDTDFPPVTVAPTRGPRTYVSVYYSFSFYFLQE